MTRWTRNLLACSALAALPSMATAQSSFKSFDVCGGSYTGMSVFGLCAAIDVSTAIINNTPTVTIHAWNLSGSSANAQESFAWGNIVGIGLMNVIPSAADAIGGTLKVTGPCFANPSGCDYTQYWNIGNNFGLNGLVIDMLALQSGTGITSTCDPNNPLISRPLYLYTACDRTSPSFVTISFNTTQYFDLADGGDLYLKGQIASGERTFCTTGNVAGSTSQCVDIVASPEPGTLALLGSGLMGFGGVGFFRRKKKEEEAEALD